jgi:hypothetical protein
MTRRSENVCPSTGLELRPLGRPVRSQSLYRLSYPSSLNYKGRPESKDRLRIGLAQVNEMHHFKVNGRQ